MADAHTRVDPNDPLFVKLRQLRNDLGTPTYREIGEKTGMSLSTVSNVLRGTGLPRWDIVWRVGAGLGGERAELRKLYDAMYASARSRGDHLGRATPCHDCGCLIVDADTHATACAPYLHSLRGALTGYRNIELPIVDAEILYAEADELGVTPVELIRYGLELVRQRVERTGA